MSGSADTRLEAVRASRRARHRQTPRIAIVTGAATVALLLVGAGFAAMGSVIEPPMPAARTAAGQMSPAEKQAPVVATPAAPRATPTQPAAAQVGAAGTPPAAASIAATSPAPRPSTCGAPSNPYGFSFCAGVIVLWADLPGDICLYFRCTPTFWTGEGYLVQCHNGRYSMTGGLTNACSGYGGAWRRVHRHG